MARHRLALQIHLAVVVVVALFGATVWLAWLTFPAPAPKQLAEFASTVLPPATTPASDLEHFLRGVTATLPIDLAVFDSERRLVAATRADLPQPRTWRGESHWIPGRGGLTMALRVVDGRWLVVQHRPLKAEHNPGRHLGGFLGALLLLVLATSVVAYPFAHRLTRRLARRRERVEDLGGGDLTARVAVEGRDEVADLARSFNRAAERIEALVGGQRRVLASASHELRSPLARLRVAIELLAGDIRVADRGPGVPEAERERIFLPFYRPPGTAETGQGFGLGLSLVRQIARAHGGDARHLPRDGGGSVFEVDLPCVDR